MERFHIKTKYNLDFWFLRQKSEDLTKESPYSLMATVNGSWRLANYFRARHIPHSATDSSTPYRLTLYPFSSICTCLTPMRLSLWLCRLVACKVHLYPNCGGTLCPSFTVLSFFNWIIVQGPMFTQNGECRSNEVQSSQGRLTWKSRGMKLWMLRHLPKE